MEGKLFQVLKNESLGNIKRGSSSAKESTGSPFTPSTWLDKDKSFHPRFFLDSALRFVGESPMDGRRNPDDSLVCRVIPQNQRVM